MTKVASDLPRPWLWRRQLLHHRWSLCQVFSSCTLGATEVMGCGAEPAGIGVDQTRRRGRSWEWFFWKGLGRGGMATVVSRGSGSLMLAAAHYLVPHDHLPHQGMLGAVPGRVCSHGDISGSFLFPLWDSTA